MAGDHDFESRHLRLQIEFRQIVQHEDGNDAEFDNFRLRQLARPGIPVYVAADRAHRRNGCEVLENLGRADISRVNDVLRALQRRECLWAKQPMSIGDDADEDRSSQASDSSIPFQFLHELPDANHRSAHRAASDLLRVVAGGDANGIKASVERL